MRGAREERAPRTEAPRGVAAPDRPLGLDGREAQALLVLEAPRHGLGKPGRQAGIRVGFCPAALAFSVDRKGYISERSRLSPGENRVPVSSGQMANAPRLKAKPIPESGTTAKNVGGAGPEAPSFPFPFDAPSFRSSLGHLFFSSQPSSSCP